MRAAGRAAWARLWDRVAASDPGLLRLTAGLRTVASIALTLTVLSLLHASVPHLVAGAMSAMVSTFAIREKQRAGTGGDARARPAGGAGLGVAERAAELAGGRR